MLKIIARSFFINDISTLQILIKIAEKINEKNFIFQLFLDLSYNLEETKPSIQYYKFFIYLGIKLLIITNFEEDQSLEKKIENFTINETVKKIFLK